MGERIRLDNLVLYAKNEDGTYTKVGDIHSASMSIDHLGDVAKIECETYFESAFSLDNKKYEIKEVPTEKPLEDLAKNILNQYMAADWASCDRSDLYPKRYQKERPNIKRVIFNAPATIVFWGDGSKTVVKCGEDEYYDPEKGLAMAISKRFLGDKGNYYEEFKKWLPKKDPVADFTNKVRFFSKWAKDHIPGFGRR